MYAANECQYDRSIGLKGKLYKYGRVRIDDKQGHGQGNEGNQTRISESFCNFAKWIDQDKSADLCPKFQIKLQAVAQDYNSALLKQTKTRDEFEVLIARCLT